MVNFRLCVLYPSNKSKCHRQPPNWIYLFEHHCRSSKQPDPFSCWQSFPNFFQVVFFNQGDSTHDRRLSYTHPNWSFHMHLIVKHKSKHDIKVIVFSTEWGRSIKESPVEFLQTTHPPWEIPHSPLRAATLPYTPDPNPWKITIFKCSLEDSLQNNPFESEY